MLTDKEIQEYAQAAAKEMSDDDRENFAADPDSWRDGIESNHVIAVRDSGEYVYTRDRAEWVRVRDAILAELRERHGAEWRRVRDAILADQAEACANGHKAICKWEITYDHLDGRNVLVQSVGFEADEGDEWTEFKLYDGDGELYYSGRKNQHGDGFEPLDDYGQPNAGATELRYLDKNSNTWKVL
jgi:hypothetical protein